jgi:hypothetical protein
MTVATMVRGPATRAGSAARSRGASRSTKCPPPAVGATGPGNRRLRGWSSRPWRKAHRPSFPKQATTIKEFSDLVVIGSGLGTVSPVAVWPRLGARSAFLSGDAGGTTLTSAGHRARLCVVPSEPLPAAGTACCMTGRSSTCTSFRVATCAAVRCTTSMCTCAPPHGSDRRAVVQWRSQLGHGRGSPWRRTVTRSWPMTRLVSEVKRRGTLPCARSPSILTTACADWGAEAEGCVPYYQ